MKLKIFIFVIVFTILSALIFADSFVIRFDNPEKYLVTNFVLEGYDIASYKPGVYLDLVVDRQEYENLISQGYSMRITQTAQQLSSNLNSGTDLAGYRDYDEMLADLQLYEALNPDICKLYDIGDSRAKTYSDAGNSNYDDYYHDIWALKVSDNVETEEDEPSIYYLAEHHAREPISLEVVMYFLDHILTQYGTDPTITDNINNSQIWIVPLVNPDGHKIVTSEIDLWWRKNLCDNNENGIIDVMGYNPADGTDPNRNYGWQWGGASNNWGSETYQGVTPFSEPETQAIQNLLSEHHFIAGLSYHSYGELILYPFGYADGVVAPDEAALSDLAVAMANTIPGLYGGNYTPQPGWALYPCTGTTDDYSYGTYGIFSYTVELATEFIPNANQVAGICEDNLQAPLIMLDRLNHSSLQGHITDADTGDPVQAEIFIEGIDDSGENRNPYLSNQEFGSYYRLLTDGDYTVQFIAYGYETSIHQNVNINSANSTILDVALNPATADITVTGVVSDVDTGWPIEGAVVEIPGYNIPSVTTNFAGEYEINNLYSFPYDFLVYADDYASTMQNVFISSTNNVADFTLAILDDGTFESGEFASSWNFDGNQPWFIDGANMNSGSYSACSGNIYNDQTSKMYFSMYVANDDVISFYYKVSSEEDYDYLRFYIDGELQDMWSGNVDWQEAVFNVESGNHTFLWEYYKDGGVSNGYDCAWIDDIILPISGWSLTPSSLDFLTVEDCIDGLQFSIVNNSDSEIILDDIMSSGTEFPWFIDSFNMTFPYNLSVGEQLDFLVKVALPVQNFSREILTDQLYVQSDAGQKHIDLSFDDELVGNDDLPNSLTTELIGNYPNPFNPSTTFKFSLSNSAKASLNIYNMKGQLVKKLLNEELPAGIHTIEWNGKDMNSKNVSSGIYFSTLDINDEGLDYTSTKKIILLK